MKRAEKKHHKPITMGKVHLISVLLSVASCLFVFSYGFANWYQVTIDYKDDISKRNGAFQSYGVLAVESAQPNIFAFSAASFLDADGNPADTGTISVPCVIDVAACKTAFTASEWASDSMILTTTLKYENLANESDFTGGTGLFTNLNITATVNGTAVPAGSFTKDNDTLTIVYTFPCSELPNSDKATYTVEYTISLPVTEENPANFRNNLGKYISVKEDSPTRFVATAELNKAE